MSHWKPNASPPAEKQPTTFKLSLKALLLLPYRLCNPPPAVGKVRSCKVTPMFKVKLEDVLNRKHLPPLGLKDFEEWLLFVEGCPENLYFMLWLKEYVVRYDQWVAETHVKRDAQKGDQEHYRFSSQAQPSPNLTLFYLRAKQTFFTPNAEYELNIPSDILSPFHTGQFVSPHPDPIVFSEVAWEVHKMLKDSLDRFVLAAYNNVGTNRALCGMVGGSVIVLAGAVAPIAVNFANERVRWLRFLALPGMWLGLTVFIASLHGVCMMVYIFGDLRQLRKFELERPRISAPQPLDFSDAARPHISSPVPVYKSRAASSSFILPYAYTSPRTPPLPSKPSPPALAIAIPTPPRAAQHPRRESASSSSSSLSTPYEGSSHFSDSSSSLGGSYPVSPHKGEITVSPAYYDADPAPEGPATRTGPSAFAPDIPHTAECRFNRTCRSATAAFIHAFDDDGVYESSRERDVFDFDALPPPPCICAMLPALASSIALPESHASPAPTPSSSASTRPDSLVPLPDGDTHPARCAALLGRAQYKCNRDLALLAHPPADPEKGGCDARKEKEKHKYARAKPRPAPTVIQTRHKWIRSVPAFGPVTRVLSPVVSRAQWEIVVRSAFVAFVVSLTVVGCLVAVPVNK